VLTPQAVEFIADLHRAFDSRRRGLLAARAERQIRFDAGDRVTSMKSRNRAEGTPTLHLNAPKGQTLRKEAPFNDSAQGLSLPG
jgi:malate synthase